MSGKRLTAAGVALATLCVVAAASGRPAPPSGHTCSATDRQFIDVAQLNMASLTSSAEDFLQGTTKADAVIATAGSALQNMKGTHPEDPSLAKTRAILGAMFVEYGKAIRADAKHRDPGRYIYRAYGLANFAHDVLAEAQRPLQQRGCDVSPLL